MYTREIIYSLISKWSEPINWEIISQMASVGSHNTVAEYIDLLEAVYALKVLYQARFLGGGEISFRKRKKVYFIDPFIYHTLNAWSAGLTDPYKSAVTLLTDTEKKSKLVEGLIGIHLYKYFPSVLFWRNQAEIDFICFEEQRTPCLYVESKYQGRITSDDKKGLKKVNGGLILSKTNISYDSENHIAIIPVAYFLAGMAID